MLCGLKARRSSHACRFIDTSAYDDRTRILRSDTALAVLPGDSEDIAAEGQEEHYCALPDDMKMTYADFVRWLEHIPGFSKKPPEVVDRAAPAAADAVGDRPRNFEAEVEAGGDSDEGDDLGEESERSVDSPTASEDGDDTSDSDMQVIVVVMWCFQ